MYSMQIWFFQEFIDFFCFYSYVIKWSLISEIFCSPLTFSRRKSHKVTTIPRPYPAHHWGIRVSNHATPAIIIIIIKYLMDVDENTPPALHLPCPATPTRRGKKPVNSCQFSTPRRRKTAGLTNDSTLGTLKQWPRIGERIPSEDIKAAIQQIFGYEPRS